MNWPEWIPRLFGKKGGQKPKGVNGDGKTPEPKKGSMGRPVPPPDLFRDQVKPHLSELFGKLIPAIAADWAIVKQNSLCGQKPGEKLTSAQLSQGTSDLWKYNIREYLTKSVQRILGSADPLPDGVLEKVYQAFLAEFNSMIHDQLGMLFAEEQAKQITDRSDLTFGQAVLMYRKLGKVLAAREAAATSQT